MTRITQYTVRESRRAKSVRLRMSARHGLVVVVPKGFDVGRIPGLLERKKDWLNKAEEKARQQQKFFRPGSVEKSPEKVSLRAIGEEWDVEYRSTASPWVAVVERKGNRLLVHGDINKKAHCRNALRRWLNRKTHQNLVPWLRRLAEDRGFEISRTFVKSQRTRWASCSPHKTISLNHKLLFLPSQLVRYVFIHELCHTVYLNHSSRFWALMKKHAPRFEETDLQLRSAWRYVPSWVDGKRLVEDL